MECSRRLRRRPRRDTRGATADPWARALRAERLRLGLHQDEFGPLIGYPALQNVVSDIERGKRAIGRRARANIELRLGKRLLPEADVDRFGGDVDALLRYAGGEQVAEVGRDRIATVIDLETAVGKLSEAIARVVALAPLQDGEARAATRSRDRAARALAALHEAVGGARAAEGS